ncbi:MAG: ABC transporter ATP-binding protein [Candidatus Eremiobacteraeota bacterium]|nr:ABC transporter ATP-binding protein [Candidatus Eremiobacteraeota bacterium]
MKNGKAAVLQVERLATFRGRVQILWDVSLEVRRGETVAIVGPNGAGKTTLPGSIVGLFPPAQGRVRVRGDDVTGAMPEAIARRGVAVVPERRQLFGPLTVRENLLLGAFVRHAPRRTLESELGEVLELFPALRPLLRTAAGSLSGGEQQMVAIGRALMAKPQMLLLDKPSLGLAPRVRAENFAALRKLADAGATILLVEQNLRMAARICRRAYFMERGRIVEGSAEDLVKGGKEYFLGSLSSS